MRATVVGECDGGLLGDHTLALDSAPRTPRHTSDRGDGIGHDYSAASTTPATRRLLRVSSSYCSCHSVGPFDGAICTAVTLYSGQFVAQSEKSVVITLACVSG